MFSNIKSTAIDDVHTVGMSACMYEGRGLSFLIRLISLYCSPDVTSFNNQTCREKKYWWMERRPQYLPVAMTEEGQILCFEV